MRYGLVLCGCLMLCTIACGTHTQIKTEIPSIQVANNTEPTELIRAAWWRTLGGDFAGARTLFEQSGDHPWSRLGLAYLARLKLDQTRVNVVLFPLLKDESMVGEIARSWSSNNRRTPWMSLAVKDHQTRSSSSPYLDLVVGKTNGTKQRAWTPANVGESVEDTLLTAQHLHRQTYELRPTHQCVRISGAAPLSVHLNDKFTSVVVDDTQLIETNSNERLSIIWVSGHRPTVSASNVACERFTSSDLAFIKSDDDLLLKRFVERLFALSHNKVDQILKADLTKPNEISITWRLQTLEALSRKGVLWNVERRRLMKGNTSAQPARLTLARAHNAHTLKDFGLAWQLLSTLQGKHTDNREVLMASIRTLSALGRDEQARRYANRYLQRGQPNCADINTIWGALGQQSHLIGRLINSHEKCGHLAIAIEHALRWSRIKTAMRLAKSLGTSEHDVRLRSRILSAAGRLTEARDLIERLSPIRSSDLSHYMRGDVPEKNTLLKLRHLSPNHPTSLRLSSWFEAIPTTPNPRSPQNKDDVDTARVLSKATVVSLDSSGEGHQVHHERLRINHMLGARNYGEIALPDDALFPQIEIEKPNGDRLFPLDIGDKGTFSLPALHVGDILSVQFTQPVTHNPGGELEGTPVFRGSLPYARVNHSLYQLIRPLDSNWLRTASHEPNELTHATKHNRQITTMTSSHLERVWSEPSGAPTHFLGQLTRWHHPNVAEGYFRSLGNRFAILRTRNAPTLRRLCNGSTFDYSTMSMLMEGVNELSNERGLEHLDGLDYAALLSRCLTQKNVTHKVVLLAPWASSHLPAVLRLEDFSYPVFVLEDGLFWDAIGQQLPPGMVPFALRKTDGRMVFPAEDIGKPYVPKQPKSVSEKRVINIELSKPLTERISGRVTDEITGPNAYALRSHLKRGDKDTLARLGQRLLDRFSSTAQLQRIRVDVNEVSRIRLKYEFTMFAGTNVHFSAFARRLASTYTNMLSRQTDLFIDQPIDQVVTLKLDKTLQKLRALDSAVHRWNSNEYIISADHKNKHYQFDLKMSRQRIRSQNYAAFRAWCQMVEKAESFVF